MIKRLTSRERKIFVLCILTALIYAGYEGVYKPFMAQTQTIDQSITTSTRRLNKNLKLIRKAKQLERQYQVHIDKFKQASTNDQVMSSILSEIEKIAADLDLQISELKPKRVREDEFTNKFSVSLTIDSQFVDILQFLHVVQSEPNIFDVQEAYFDKTARRNASEVKTRLVLSRTFIK